MFYNAVGELNVGLVSALAVVVAALFASLVGVIGHWVNRSNAKLQANLALEVAKITSQQSRENAMLAANLSISLKLADLRQDWINKLRDDLATFQSIAVTPGTEQLIEKEFYRLGTRIELFMNPNDPDFHELQTCMYRFLAAKNPDEKFRANPAFISVSQSILKREWEKLRSEAQLAKDLAKIG